MCIRDRVTAVNNTSVKVETPMTDSITIKFEDLNKMFILKQEVMKTEEEVPTPLTKQEKSFVEDSFENVNELLKDSGRKDALKKEADKQLTEDVDTELFEDVTSDC
jgi:hypothetical protein